MHWILTIDGTVFPLDIFRRLVVACIIALIPLYNILRFVKAGGFPIQYKSMSHEDLVESQVMVFHIPYQTPVPFMN